jgi:peptide-methionine (S)-S-oxide reductase
MESAMSFFSRTPQMPPCEKALAGRQAPIPTATTHFVNDRPLKGPFPPGSERALFAMGCFWGAERKFWSLPGVYVTAVGYSGGFTPNPTYQETCGGMTGHTETVLVVYDPKVITYESLLKVFWESHDPTQVMRQGNDIGTQYRSAIVVTTPAQQAAAAASKVAYETDLKAKGFGPVVTEITEAGEFYYAEDYHQQYLAKNPGGYCGLGGTGVACQIGTGVRATAAADGR